MVDESGLSHVIATYREIASHFGLVGPNAARTKAKRAEWEEEPTNHPAETKRIKVPRDAWDASQLESPRSPKARAPSQQRPRAPSQEGESPTLRVLSDALMALREQLTKAEAQEVAANARAERVEAALEHERRGRQLDREAAAEREGWLRDQLARAEARYNRHEGPREQELARIVELKGEIQAESQPPESRADTARPAWRSFLTRVLGRQGGRR